MKYVDAEYIKAVMLNDRLMQGNAEFTLYKQQVDIQVNALPSIDIIRCKECKWGEVVRNHSIGFCENQCGVRSAITESSYCSYGERREP